MSSGGGSAALIRVPLEPAQFLAGNDVPDADRIVTAAGENEPVVWGGGSAIDFVIVSLETPDFLAGGDIPEDQNPIKTSGEGAPAAVYKKHQSYLVAVPL